MSTYGKKLKRLRKSKNLKQNDIALAVNEGRQTISLIEGGKKSRRFPIEFVKILHDRLQVPYSYWFDDADYSHSLNVEPEDLYKTDESGLRIAIIKHFSKLDEVNCHIVFLTFVLNCTEKENASTKKTVQTQ